MSRLYLLGIGELFKVSEERIIRYNQKSKASRNFNRIK